MSRQDRLRGGLECRKAQRGDDFELDARLPSIMIDQNVNPSTIRSRSVSGQISIGSACTDRDVELGDLRRSAESTSSAIAPIHRIQTAVRRLGAPLRTNRTNHRAPRCCRALPPAGFIANNAWIQRFAPALLRRSGLQLGTSGDDGQWSHGIKENGAVTDRWTMSRLEIHHAAQRVHQCHHRRPGRRRIIDETRYGAAVGRAIIRDHDANHAGFLPTRR